MEIKFPTVFSDQVGKLEGEHHIHLDPSVCGSYAAGNKLLANSTCLSENSSSSVRTNTIGLIHGGCAKAEWKLEDLSTPK